MGISELSNFDIVFDNDITDCVSGQTVQGQVRLTLLKPLTVRAVRFRVNGRAWTRYEVPRSSDQGGSDVYGSEEKYLDENTTLWGNALSNSPLLVIQPGIYKFSFAFVIPNICPSTTSGPGGAIEYGCKAYISIPTAWRFNPKCTKGFKVFCPVDLNEDPNNMCLQGKSFSTVVGCWCCTSGTIHGEFSVERQAYLPGEPILISGKINNNSSAMIHQVKAKLIKSYTSNAGGRFVGSEDTIGLLQKQGVSAGQTQFWTNEPLLIPNDASITIHNCGIIKLQYKLFITAVLQGCYSNLEIDFPIVVRSYVSDTN